MAFSKYPLTSITVYCSSSSAVDKAFFDIAEQLGEKMAELKLTLIYGGANVGLMGKIAHTVKENGGKVIGVMPPVISEKGITNPDLDELIKAADMRERKRIMAEMGDAFIALPGGFGTLEEIVEVLTEKQLQIHNKPIVFLNINGCFDALFQQFNYFVENRFAKPVSLEFYYNASSVKDAFEYLLNYQGKDYGLKWF